MEDLRKKWNRCVEKIRSNIGEDRYNTWFSKIEVQSFENNNLVLMVPSRFYVEKLEDDFYDILSKSIWSVFGKNITLSYDYYVISDDKESKVAIESPKRSHVLTSKLERSIIQKAEPEKAFVFDSQLNDSLNFENYCVGRSNKLPFTIAEHIANHPDKPDFNPFFLYGNVGVGKTHLAQAIGIRIKERNPRANVLYITMRQFQNLYANATIKREIPNFINWFQQMDCILFDDLQELSNKSGTADALFPIFNHLHQNNKKLIFTCDRPPMELDGIADRLIDRFKWGITEPLDNPDYGLRVAILKAKAARNGLDISNDIIDLIAKSTNGSVRELEGIVMGLYTHSITENEPISIELAHKVIGHLVKKVEKKIVNFDMIVENTAEFYHLNPDAIFSKSRLRDIADARQMIMYLCHKHTDLSSPAIGAKLNRKHTTVLHGISTISERLQVEPNLTEVIASIEKMILD
ncbi:MAG: chromosomal replication initiator protein DnaA [Bacteroidales bacterium]|nr:chromosomal replication initiator protein DnaA [Bacteroidales bacterium]